MKYFRETNTLAYFARGKMFGRIEYFFFVKLIEFCFETFIFVAGAAEKIS